MQDFTVFMEHLPSEVAPFVSRTLTLVLQGTVLLKNCNIKALQLHLFPVKAVAEIDLIKDASASKVGHIQLAEFHGGFIVVLCGKINYGSVVSRKESRVGRRANTTTGETNAHSARSSKASTGCVLKWHNLGVLTGV